MTRIDEQSANGFADGEPRPMNTRERIGFVALELFSGQGYDGTPVREIAEAIGVTTPALYYHFDTKEEVLRACVDPYLDAIDDLLADWVDPPAAGDELERFVDGYVDVLITHRDIVRFLHRDIAAARLDGIADRLSDQREAILLRLGANAGDPSSWVRASSSMGAVRNPIVMLEGDLVAHRTLLLDSVRRILHRS